MKKMIAVSLVAVLLAGCASGPSTGHYYTDAQGNQQYEPSAEAKNKDSWETAGWITAIGGAIAGVTLGIVALTK